MNTIRIGSYFNETIIIPEAGVNHNGSIQEAKKLIEVATDAGINYVKFQTFKARIYEYVRAFIIRPL